jgi:L-ascorbate metabolism protein UlaG (beta-lactamase superfamily)
MAKLYYQGHGSYRITSNKGQVIYVDPYAGIGYDKPADIILVTHQHSDHNQIQLCSKKPTCKIITNEEALNDGIHNSFKINDIIIESVEAYNKNHDINKCVGYIITIDRVSIYCSGDTSITNQMSTFKDKQITYALYPLDGFYNMNLKEGEEAATLVAAKHNIPIHLKPGQLFDKDRALEWNAPNKLIIEPNEEIELI